MEKKYVFSISIFLGAVGIFLIIIGAIVRGQIKSEEIKPAIRAEAPMGPGSSLKRGVGLQDLERPKEFMQAPGAKEEGGKEEIQKEYDIEDISLEEAQQVEGSAKAAGSEGASEEAGTAESAQGEEKLNVQPPAEKLKEMKAQGVVIY